jgi:DNA-binding transcriptional ArsR family regulator
MGATKRNIHSKDSNDIAAVAKVFAHPARVAILLYISKQKSCICNDIVDEIGLEQPTISQHLQVISKAGLINGDFKGNSLRYCLDVERFQEFQNLFNAFFIKINKSNC